MMLDWLVGMILGPMCLQECKQPQLLRYFNHWNLTSLELEDFEVMVPIVRPCVVLLSVVNGMGSDCGCLISCSATLYSIARLHP